MSDDDDDDDNDSANTDSGENDNERSVDSVDKLRVETYNSSSVSVTSDQRGIGPSFSQGTTSLQLR